MIRQSSCVWGYRCESTCSFFSKCMFTWNHKNNPFKLAKIPPVNSPFMFPKIPPVNSPFKFPKIPPVNSPFQLAKIPPVNLVITIVEMYLLYISRGRKREIYSSRCPKIIQFYPHKKPIVKDKICTGPALLFPYCTDGINSAPRFGIIPYFLVPDYVFLNTIEW